MNKSAQTLAISIITAVVVLIIGLMVINFVKDEVTTARNDLNCESAATITDGTKLLCLVVDIQVVYWIWIIFSIVIGGITSRFIS